MTIYLDAIFLLNLLFNFLILLLTQAIVKHDTKMRRILFGAFIATLLVPLTIYFPGSFFTTILGKLIYSFIIVYSAYARITKRQFLKLLSTFYFVSFLMGGGLVALYFMLNDPFAIEDGHILTYRTGFGHVINWLFVVIAFPLVLVFARTRMKNHLIEQVRYDQIYELVIRIKGKNYETKGFIDSGNQLVEPLTRIPVIICDEHFLKRVFTEDEWLLLKDAFRTLDLGIIPEKWKSRISIVPFKGVEGSSNVLFTLRPDSLVIHYENKEFMSSRLLIGIQFSELTDDRRYNCLLNPLLIHTATIKSA